MNQIYALTVACTVCAMPVAYAADNVTVSGDTVKITPVQPTYVYKIQKDPGAGARTVIVEEKNDGSPAGTVADLPLRGNIEAPGVDLDIKDVEVGNVVAGELIVSGTSKLNSITVESLSVENDGTIPHITVSSPNGIHATQGVTFELAGGTLTAEKVTAPKLTLASGTYRISNIETDTLNLQSGVSVSSTSGKTNVKADNIDIREFAQLEKLDISGKQTSVVYITKDGQSLTEQEKTEAKRYLPAGVTLSDQKIQPGAAPSPAPSPSPDPGTGPAPSPEPSPSPGPAPDPDALAAAKAASEMRAKEDEQADPFAKTVSDAAAIENIRKSLGNAAAMRREDAVRTAGRTFAAPVAGAVQAAGAISHVAAVGVAERTSNIRMNVASAFDEETEAMNRVWLSVKRGTGEMSDDVYGKSDVSYLHYQLGYDAPVSEKDTVGAYVSTTRGHIGYQGQRAAGRMEIKNAMGFGVYGTHKMERGEFLDYMVSMTKFDSRRAALSIGTNMHSVMLGYGKRIEMKENALTPYLQLFYDHVKVDGYRYAGNRFSPGVSDNVTMKLGMKFDTQYGITAGLAYSRGISGGLAGTMNGISMPKSNNDKNVLYTTLSYKTETSANTAINVTAEKTFMDYKSWSFSGQFNYYF